MRYAIWIGALVIAGCASPAKCPTTTDAAVPPAAKPATATGVTGIGGVFFKAKDPKALKAWYATNLGIPQQAFGAKFEWRQADVPTQPGSTVWTIFPATTKYFETPFMLNYRVHDLDGVVARLRAAGAKVDDKIESDENGRFVGGTDPEGNQFQLWEPVAGK